MKLGRYQIGLIIGMVLGDGFLQKTGSKNARLRLEHSIKQKDYLLWKISQLRKLFQRNISYVKRTHFATKREYLYVRAQSNATPELGKIREIFYKEGRKSIPENFQKYFKQPISLAVWYLDDGYYYKRDKCSYLYIGRVKQDEAKIVSETIRSNFGIESIVKDKKRKGFVLYFSPRQTLKLKKKIEEFVIPQMKYKLPPDPVTTEDLYGLR